MVTASSDGHVKFWKKQEQGVEFVKHYRAHLGTYTGVKRERESGRRKEGGGREGGRRREGRRGSEVRKRREKKRRW